MEASLVDAEGKRDLWAGCVSQIHFEGAGLVTLQSADHAPPTDVLPDPLPDEFARGAWFCLTAHNPYGNEQADELNDEASARLEERLRALNDPTPVQVCASAGMDETASWREDGFAVQFTGEDAERGEAAILALAGEFHQAAIFAYAAERAGDGNTVYQRCVACFDTMREVESRHRVVRRRGPGLALK